MSKSIPHSAAIASRCNTTFVEPPVAVAQAIPFSKASLVNSSCGLRPRRRISMTNSPAWTPILSLRGSVAPGEPDPIAAIPRNSSTVAIVFAVYCAPHAPAPGHAAASNPANSSSVIVPAACLPTPSKTSWIVTSSPCQLPGAIEPEYRTIPGIFSRANAMAPPGIVLSQPTIITAASNE